MRLFDSLALQRLIGSLRHRRRDAKDLQRTKQYQSARTGTVTLIQRFGSALNLNIHFEMGLLDRTETSILREPT